MYLALVELHWKAWDMLGHGLVENLPGACHSHTLAVAQPLEKWGA